MKREAAGVRYVVTDLPQDAHGKLSDPPLPGLQVADAGDQFAGRLDAIAAAYARLNDADVPRTRPWQKTQGWPAPQLRTYQQRGVAWLRSVLDRHGGAILADDMGLGKTLQAITIAKIRRHGVGGRTLVVAPASARETWRQQLAKWAPGESVFIHSPKSVKKTKATDAQWVVCSYEAVLSGQVEEVAFTYDYPDTLIIDEAHRIKGRKTKRSNALKQLAGMCGTRLALTGTPVWNRPRDLWMLLDVLIPGAFGNQYAFDEAYCAGGMGEHGWQNKGASNTQELRQRLEFYMLRREKQEVAHELPPLTREVRWIDAQPKATAALHKFELDPDGRTMARALEATHDGKIDEAVNLCVEAGKFLCFTWTKANAAKIAKGVIDAGGDCELITGEVQTEERQRRIDAATQRGAGVVATIDSCSEAVTMTELANVGIMHGIDWVPTKMAQAEARLHRIGTVKPVTWVYLAMKQSADRLVIESVINKLDAFISTMNAKSIGGMKHALGAHVDGAGIDDVNLLQQMARLLESADEREDVDD